MRVIGGTARSIPLQTPKGDITRPTTDRIKETLFNMLQMHLGNAIFVDLYSGSGGIGIEALSRGAKKAYFIEQNREAMGCIRSNLEKTHFLDSAVTYQGDVLTFLKHEQTDKADLIFADPPYHAGVERELLHALYGSTMVTDDTIVVIEASSEYDFEWVTREGYQVFKIKNYGSCKHLFLRKQYNDHGNGEEYEESNLSR